MKKSKNIKLLKVIILDIILITALVLTDYYVVYIRKEKMEVSKVTTSTNEKENTSELSDGNYKEDNDNKFSSSIISTDTTYKSKDISIDITKNEMGSGNNKITYYVADIYLSDIRSLESCFAENTYGTGFSESVLDMDKNNSAIIAINGDSYSSNKNDGKGTIIRNGQVYREESTSLDTCVLFYDGTMKVYPSGAFNLKEVSKEDIYQTWVFGPGLLDDNGKALTSFNGSSYLNKNHPRTALGYYEPGHYCFVVVDGRQEGYSEGMTLSQLAEVFEKLGCKVAYNLDGGYSSTMTFNDEIVNESKKYRDVTDGIIIKEVNNN